MTRPVGVRVLSCFGGVSIAYPAHHIELLRQVKKVFDPLGILNPGKILPDV